MYLKNSPTLLKISQKNVTYFFIIFFIFYPIILQIYIYLFYPNIWHIFHLLPCPILSTFWYGESHLCNCPLFENLIPMTFEENGYSYQQAYSFVHIQTACILKYHAWSNNRNYYGKFDYLYSCALMRNGFIFCHLLVCNKTTTNSLIVQLTWY